MTARNKPRFDDAPPFPLWQPDVTDSPEAKAFLTWLRANGYTAIWQAYDRNIRTVYARELVAEIARVMEDPWFGEPPQ